MDNLMFLLEHVNTIIPHVFLISSHVAYVGKTHDTGTTTDCNYRNKLKQQPDKEILF